MPEVISLRSLIVASQDNVSCALGDEVAILQIRSGIYFGLDPVGARLWNLLREPHTVEQLREELLSEYDVEPERCEEDLLALLETLHAQGLIEIRRE
jgi:Coenzyme PQQ synthesis protein D (PqqD)